MFKNLSLFRAPALAGAAFVDLHEVLDGNQFVPCGPTQAISCGWLPVRGQAHGAVLESIAGHWLAKFCVETKSVPKAAVDRALAEQCAAIEQSTGRKPGRKEQRELKDEIVLGLLPNAFPKTAGIWVWIDPATGLVGLDATSSSKTDHVLTALVNAVDGLSITPVNTQESPSSWMVHMLMVDIEPEKFDLGREVELSASDETKAKVRYDNMSIEGEDEIMAHIKAGRTPTKIGLVHESASFVLTDKLTIRKLDIEDTTTEAEGAAQQDALDADFVIFVGAAKPLVEDLIAALGGEISTQPQE